MTKFREALCFDDVSIVDGYSDIKTRSSINMLQSFGNSEVMLPVVTASMDTVTNLKVAEEILGFGGVYVHHRYCSIADRIQVIKDIRAWQDDWGVDVGLFGAAIGLNDDFSDITRLIEAGANVLSLDVASCNNLHVIKHVDALADLKMQKDFKLIVGNFSSSSFVHSIYEEIGSVDFLKVSQGGGSACTTRVNIGVGVPTFQAILDLKEKLDDVVDGTDRPKIIADGGIKTPGDIVKALGAGAHLVMLGSMLAGHAQSPGDVIEYGDKKLKSYRGMASAEAKMEAGMAVKHVEGVSSLIPFKGDLNDTLMHIRQCIQSGVATAGWGSVEEFIGNAEFVRLTSAGQRESSPHIFSGRNKLR